MIRDRQFYEWLADAMSNFEVSSDEELIEYFIAEGELTQKEAEAILATRPTFRTSPMMLLEEALFIIEQALRKAHGTDETIGASASEKRNKSTNMKITKLNYFSEYNRTDKVHFTESFTRTHELLQKLTSNGTDWAKVNANSVLTTMAEKQFKYLDMIKQKQGNETSKPKAATKSSAPKKATPAKKERVKSAANPQPAKVIKRNTGKMSPGSPVETVDPHLAILTRYRRMDGKTIPKERIAALARTLVKQIEARILRKASEHSKLIEQMREQLFSILENSKGANVRVSIPEKTVAAIDKVITSEHQMKSVQLLRRYAGMAGRTTSVEKAKRLYNSMVAAVEKEHIPQDDRYFERTIQVMKNLKAYVEKGDERKQLKLLPAELSGILGCGCKPNQKSLNGFDEDEDELDEDYESDTEEHTQIDSSEPICSTEFMGRKFVRYPIEAPWVQIFGAIEPGKHTIVYSKEKLGKTTAMVDFAGYLSKRFGPVLFVQKEEELSGTFQDKLKNTQAANPNLFLIENLPSIEDLKQFKFVFLDSVSRLDISPLQLTKLQKKLGKGTTIIAILHATKDGKHRGSNDYAHDAAQIVEFPEFGAAIGRGRFAGTTGELIRFTDPRE